MTKKSIFGRKFFSSFWTLKNPNFFFTIFRARKKIFFFGVEKKLGYSFDAEKSDLSVYEVFNTFPALYAAQKTFILFFPETEHSLNPLDEML